VKSAIINNATRIKSAQDEKISSWPGSVGAMRSVSCCPSRQHCLLSYLPGRRSPTAQRASLSVVSCFVAGRILERLLRLTDHASEECGGHIVERMPQGRP
jgi:hypothetical protein